MSSTPSQKTKTSISDKTDELAQSFLNPPDSAKPRVYWWWLNSLVNKEGITRDMEQFKAKGIGGILLFDAGGEAGPMPKGSAFMSPEWRELFRHALREAHRLGLEVSVNLCSGWDAGGPWITPEFASKHFVQSELKIKGPQKFSAKLPQPPADSSFYQDIAVQAFPESPDKHISLPQDLSPLAIKSARDSLRQVDKTVLECIEAALPNLKSDSCDSIISPSQIIDLTAKLTPDGQLTWDIPQGNWTILRTGFTITGKKVSCSTAGGEGFEMDFLNASAMDHHFKSIAQILLDDAGPLAATTLKYFHDDSWEVELPNWTQGFTEDFKKYRGYDPTPYLPVLAGRMVISAEISDRFLYDFRKTIADCLAENHYRRFADLSHAKGLGIHSESGGPCFPTVVPMDAIKNLGRDDFPMGEFWQSQHYKQNNQNQVGKQTASAAHIYGKKFAAAEAFTNLNRYCHWYESPYELKPTADIAFCEGLNRFVLHTATSTRPEDGLPGYEYFAGSHFNPNITWWNQSASWLTYLSRCQFMLQQGLFVADVCYYNGDFAPNLVEPKHTDPSLGTGYDYDVCNTEVLLTRMSVRNNRIVLPDGMSYRILVLPNRDKMPLEILQKLKDLVSAGATIAGPKPLTNPGLKNYPACDKEIAEIASDLWGNCDGSNIKQHNFGKGRVFWGKSIRDILLADNIAPDFEYSGSAQNTYIDFIHRRLAETDIYFVANRNNRLEKCDLTFRVTAKKPELWNPVTGQMKPAASFRQNNNRTTIPFQFDPYGSFFVVFRKPIASAAAGSASSNFSIPKDQQEITGPWKVNFDPNWGGPVSIRFDNLINWAKSTEDGIRFYSGLAVYHKTFDLPQSFQTPGTRISLDLGEVKNIAHVRLNGIDLGILWTQPFRIDITKALQPANNILEIDIVNLWPNRLIGDASLPAEKRFTKTNVAFDKNTPLLDSGLLGPVNLITMEEK